jgi:hypothetical protein
MKKQRESHMSASTASEIPIKRDALTEYSKYSKALLTSVEYTAGRDLEGLRRQLSGDGVQRAFASQDEKPKARKVAILDIARRLSGDKDILDEDMSFIMTTVQTGIQIGFYVAAQYDQFSGLRTVRQMQTTTDLQKGEMGEKIATQAAVAAYVLSLYVSWKFGDYKKEELAAMPAEFPGLPESIPLSTQYGAMNALVFHWGSYLEGAQSSFHALKLTQFVFKAALDELKRRSGELKYPDAFTGQRYRLEKSSFAVDGFKNDAGGTPAVIEFTRMEKKQIIGNKQAKALVERLVQFSMAYDFDRKMNPAVEIGGFPWNFCLSGLPGTGKTMVLQLMMTLMQDYAKLLGIPFGILDMPSDIKAGVQGESAARYAAFCRQMDVPNMLLAVLNDDCETLYPDRRGLSVDEGSRGIIMTHIRFTQGATSNIRGNVLWGNATNNPHLIDPAVYSRFMAKVVVPGAQTEHDFADMVEAFQRKTNMLVKDGKIIDLRFPNEYTYLADQAGFEEVEEKRDRKKYELVTFKNTRLVEVYDEIKALQGIDLNQNALYAKLFSILHSRFEGFTSRDVSNITQNVMLELFGHSFPKQWLEDKDAFISKDYQTKKEMIVKHGLDNLAGPVHDVLWNQTANYIEANIAMLDSGRQKRIEEMANNLAEQEAARVLDASRKQAAVPAG